MDSETKEREFTALFREHYTSVRQFVSAFAAEDDVEDIVADVFLVAWRRLDEIDSEMIGPWLLGVARNVLRSRYRSRKRFDAFLRRLEVQSGSSTASSHEPAAVEADLVRRSMRHLDEADAEILVLSAWNDLGPIEIAVVLGITKNSAGVKLFRARERLRKIVARHDAEGAAS